MKKPILLLPLTLLLLFACKEEEVKQPNIIIILADDLGYGDPRVYNSESKIPTPNIDELAARGMRFTDAHTPSSVCTPTRYGLLTGRYAWRTQLKKSVLWEGGHRVPFMVSWPPKIPANTVNDQLICLTDIISSIASILSIPTEVGTMEDSYDISSYLFSKAPGDPVRESIVHHSGNGTFAIRRGSWKLILGKDSGGFSNGLKNQNIPVATAGQLYKISDDFSEQNNLYAENPGKVKELTELLDQYKIDGTSTDN